MLPRSISAATSSESIDKKRVDDSVHVFCECGRLCISDFRITDTDAHSYRHKDQMKVLVDQGKEKRDRYLECCRELCKDFTTTVYTVDVMANRETKMAEKRLVSHLAKKWHHPYSQMVSSVRLCIRLYITMSNIFLICIRHYHDAVRPFIQSGSALHEWHTWEKW